LTDDAYIHGLRPTSAYGTRDDIFVTSYGPKQGLVRFDAASIAGLEINSATLKLYLNDIERAGTISIHAVTSSWNESTVTWNNQPPTETSATAVVSLATADEGSVISIDVTEVVERWADGSLADGGFLIVTTDSIKAYFDAKEKPGGTPATLEVDTGPPAFTGEAIVLDLSNPDNCIIDEPGYYVLDRTWLLTPDGNDKPNANCNAVHITSGGVTLDLRGFAIRRPIFGGNYEPVLWIDTEYSVTLQNGRFSGIFVSIEASVASDRYLVTLDNIHAGGSVLLGNRRVFVTGGSFSGSNEVSLSVGEGRPQFGEGSRVEAAALSCNGAECLSTRGLSLIRDCTFSVNTIGAPAIVVHGDGTIVEGNVLDSFVRITGNNNVVARNFSSGGDPYIEVNGTGNIVEGNIGPGIVFEAPGNFYGNNRVALPGGITGTDGNEDWGGNVTY
jgi:hypothetical protein